MITFLSNSIFLTISKSLSFIVPNNFTKVSNVFIHNITLSTAYNLTFFLSPVLCVPPGAVVPLACDPTIIPRLHFTIFLGCFHCFLDSVTFSFLIFFHFSGVYIPSNNVQRKGSFLLTLNPDISENDSVSVFILDG